MEKDALDHLCNVLVMLSDLTPGDRCRALDDALEFYNAQRPDWRVQPIGGVYSELRHFSPLTEGFDPSRVPHSPTE